MYTHGLAYLCGELRALTAPAADRRGGRGVRKEGAVSWLAFSALSPTELPSFQSVLFCVAFRLRLC